MARESPTLAQKSLFADDEGGGAGAAGETHVEGLGVELVVGGEEGGDEGVGDFICRWEGASRVQCRGAGFLFEIRFLGRLGDEF